MDWCKCQLLHYLLKINDTRNAGYDLASNGGPIPFPETHLTKR